MPRYVQDPAVVFTELEEGGVLLHLSTKFYYSLNDSGLAIWRLVEEAGEPQAIVRGLVARYAIEEPDAEPIVARFLERLQQEQLAEAVEGESSAAAGGSELPTAERRTFEEPQLLKHDEPLHEVVMNPFDPQLPLAE